jgi:hypothetical protein
MCTFILGREVCWHREPSLYAGFIWVQGKITRGRLLTFNGAGKGLAGNFYVGKVNMGKHPRTAECHK